MEPDFATEDARPAPTGVAPARLKKRAEFQRVARGRRKSVEAFTLQAARREGGASETARVGLTVTKKVGNAVVRNRIRRRLRAALAAASPLEVEADHDYVLVARREALSRRFGALTDDLRQAFNSVAPRENAGRRPQGPRAAKDRAAQGTAPKDRDRRT